MVPRELDSTTPWPQAKANVKMQEIRAVVIAELCDEDRANGIPEPGKCHEIDDDGNITVNPAWSMLHHAPVKLVSKETDTEPAVWDGTNVRLIERWRAFCAEPQDSSLVKIPMGEVRHKWDSDDLAGSTIMGVPPAEFGKIASPNRHIDAASAPVKKRRGGRPKGSKNKPKVTVS